MSLYPVTPIIVVGGGTFIGGIWLVIGGNCPTKLTVACIGCGPCIIGGGQLTLIGGGAIPIPGGGNIGWAIREGILFATDTVGCRTTCNGFCMDIGEKVCTGGGILCKTGTVCVVWEGIVWMTMFCCGGGIEWINILWVGKLSDIQSFECGIGWGGGMVVGGIIFGGGKQGCIGLVGAEFWGGGTVTFTFIVASVKFGGGTDLLGGGMFLMKSGSDMFFSRLSLGVGILIMSRGLGFGISFKWIGDGGGIFWTCNGAGGGIVKVFIGSGCGMLWTCMGFGGGIEANSIVGMQGGGTVITLVPVKFTSFCNGFCCGGGTVTVANTVLWDISFPIVAAKFGGRVSAADTNCIDIWLWITWGGGMFNNTGGAAITGGATVCVLYVLDGEVMFLSKGCPVTFCGVMTVVVSKVACEIRLLYDVFMLIFGSKFGFSAKRDILGLLWRSLFWLSDLCDHLLLLRSSLQNKLKLKIYQMIVKFINYFLLFSFLYDFNLWSIFFSFICLNWFKNEPSLENTLKLNIFFSTFGLKHKIYQDYLS